MRISLAYNVFTCTVDLVTTLPVGKGWQEFFASSTSRFSALRERFTGILPSSGFVAADTKAQWNGKKVHSFYPQECFSQLLLLLLHHRNTYVLTVFLQFSV